MEQKFHRQFSQADFAAEKPNLYNNSIGQGTGFTTLSGVAGFKCFKLFSHL